MTCYNYYVMNMKNKGFTLIELLVVVAIMGLIGVVVTISLTSTLNETNQKRCDEFVKEVEDAACVYAGLIDKPTICTRGNCNPIKLQILVEEGLIESEKDACTNKDINLNETVSVLWDETGEKKCEYDGVKVYER